MSNWEKQIFRVTVPAKAMLWGEYGVLLGGPAVVLSLPKYQCVCDLIATPNPTDRQNSHRDYCDGDEAHTHNSSDSIVFSVFSDFLKGGSLQLHFSDLCNAEPLRNDASRDFLFFAGICSPWKEVFKKWHITVNVTQSFPPSLGFGSSSALLAALHRTFARLAYGTPEFVHKNVFWERAFESLKKIQGGGSGYDVAVQSESLWFDDNLKDDNLKDDTLKDDTLKSDDVCENDVVQSNAVQNEAVQNSRGQVSVWKYLRNGSDAAPFLQKLNLPELSKFGVLVASHVYSDTANALVTYSRSENCARAHAALSENFLENSTFENLPCLMKISREICRAQGIVPVLGAQGAFAQICDALDAYGLAWKSMGSGNGDCLWIAATHENQQGTKAALAAMKHPISQKMISEEIVFDFSTIGGSLL